MQCGVILMPFYASHSVISSENEMACEHFQNMSQSDSCEKIIEHDKGLQNFRISRIHLLPVKAARGEFILT